MQCMAPLWPCTMTSRDGNVAYDDTRREDNVSDFEERCRLEALKLAAQHLSRVEREDNDSGGYNQVLPETDLDKQLEAAERYRKFLMDEA